MIGNVVVVVIGIMLEEINVIGVVYKKNKILDINNINQGGEMIVKIDNIGSKDLEKKVIG